MTIIEGNLATESKKPFIGQININDKTGLIRSVKIKGKDKLEVPDHVFNKDCLIFAGMGDIHIHAREDQTKKQNYKETYETASEAALHGGCVHLSAMPNTPKPLTTKQDFQWHRKRVFSVKSPVSILNYVGIDKNTKPLGKPGEHFYKLYFGKSVGDLTVTYGSELDEILSRYKKHHISFHVEYDPIVVAMT